MTTKLAIKGITFPNFDKDDSKKNFRLVFFIGYTDKNGDDAVMVVAKPTEKHWQWRNQNKDAFLKPTIVGDSVNLDIAVLKTGDGNTIPPGSQKIGEVDGTIEEITVKFMDVHDKTLADVFVNNVLPELITFWKASGLNPIDMAPVPGGVKTVIKQNFDLEKMADDAEAFFQKKLKDKVLHSINADFTGDDPFVMREDHVPTGSNGKTGTYAVTLGVTK